MDLKSENILINQEIKTIKIIDFGHAVYQNDTLWRGGVQSTLKTEKLISAEQDWNSFFFIIQLMKTKISRNSAHKIEKANKLFVKNKNQLDFQQTKAIFESKSKIRINSKLIVFICFALAFFLLFRQLNRPEKDYLKKTEPKVTQKSTIKPENQISTIVEPNLKEQKSKDEPSKIIHRIISVEDSMFFVVKASLFGPEFENELKTKSDSIKKIELFEKLMDKYSVKFEYYAQKHNLDSLKKLKAKEIYEYHLSKSINKYVHMLK
jgi:serine/threonine protein kinase